ncbi:MAG: hypothetical protein LUQ65_06780 [Candidatus Helarchaeota archaeon]|nr:hypothetical protein [Candidatus Helarchaeota archaeon]
MKVFWKWIQRAVWLIALVSYLKGWVDMDAIKLFWNDLSPWKLIFVLSVLIILYEIITFLYNLKKQVLHIQGLGDRISKLEIIINDLKEWIGLFSYKDMYSNLKGKIKVYIREELEKESTDQKDETRKYKALDELQGLDYEEAFGKLTPDERERYLQYKDKE